MSTSVTLFQYRSMAWETPQWTSEGTANLSGEILTCSVSSYMIIFKFMSYESQWNKWTHQAQFLEGSCFFDQCVDPCNSLANLCHLTHCLQVAIKITLKQTQLGSRRGRTLCTLVDRQSLLGLWASDLRSSGLTLLRTIHLLCFMWGPHSSGCGHYSLLGCNAMKLRDSLTSGRIHHLHIHGQRVHHANKPAEPGSKPRPACSSEALDSYSSQCSALMWWPTRCTVASSGQWRILHLCQVRLRNETQSNICPVSTLCLTKL
jgi:hypothetical protein